MVIQFSTFNSYFFGDFVLSRKLLNNLVRISGVKLRGRDESASLGPGCRDDLAPQVMPETVLQRQ